MTDEEATLETAIADVPNAVAIDHLAMNDVADVVWAVRLELDLIEEGQDGTDEYTEKDIREIKAFLKRWKSFLLKGTE